MPEGATSDCIAPTSKQASQFLHPPRERRSRRRVKNGIGANRHRQQQQQQQGQLYI
jgi:hypothetical protein